LDSVLIRAYSFGDGCIERAGPVRPVGTTTEGLV
jgi:hypothetical protein